jgi:hypothetical protein
MKQDAMRNGQNKRMRGRGQNRKGQNPLTRVYESNGPDVKIRGTANHVAEKYVQLARDAQSSGDPVAAENYYQHAEHYFRLIAAVQEQFRQNQPMYGEPRDSVGDEGDDEGAEFGMGGEPYAPREQPQPYQPREQREQPYQHQPRGEREHGYQPREQRFQPRDRGERGGDRDRGDRDRGDRDRHERGDREQPQQPFQARPPIQPPPQPAVADEGGDIDRLPAFVTGGAMPAPAPGAQTAAAAANGFEGGADRFPLHRRRRRRHTPREGAPAETGDAPAGE